MSGGSDYVVRVRGLPWATSATDLVDFFSDVNIIGGKDGVNVVMTREGKSSGEAFIMVESSADVEFAKKKDGKYLGRRYLEVFESSRRDMEMFENRVKGHQGGQGGGMGGGGGYSGGGGGNSECVVRLRGLPYGCSREDIAQFFAGLPIVPNGILIPEDVDGRGSGEAFVRFKSPQSAERALEKNREHIGHRYIEIFPSSVMEATATLGYRPKGPPMYSGGRPSPYDIPPSRYGSTGPMGRRGYDGPGYGGGYGEGWGGDMGGMMRGGGRSPMESGGMMGGGGRPSMGGGMKGDYGYNGMGPGSGSRGGGGHYVHMRGLPYKATTQDLSDFFKPLTPVGAQIMFDERGRASGEAKVEFSTHEEAVKAMCKDRSMMSTRYIELFLNSSPGGGGGYSGDSNGYGGAGSYRTFGRSSGGFGY